MITACYARPKRDINRGWCGFWMSVKEATSIVGGKGNADKMPGRTWGISAWDCYVGEKLSQIKGSVCEKCYARTNFYRMSNVKNAHARRKASLSNPQWVPAQVVVTAKESYFRWFDSGDLQSMSMLIKIVAVACMNPHVNYWLPTKEYAIVSKYRKMRGYVPPNLVIRVSAPMINQRLNSKYGLTSMVITDGHKVDSDVSICDAAHTYKDGRKAVTITKDNKKQLGHCGDCRKCWDPTNKTTAYPIH